MKKRTVTWLAPLVSILVSLIVFNGCGNSGYNTAEPYVITGTVSNGAAVSGTVHVLTNKRNDSYQGVINSETGAYQVSVTIPDPPYFVWAVIDGDRTLFSYTRGRRNSEANDIKDQTVNINRLTDLVMSMTYLEDTADKFGDQHSGLLPNTTDLEFFQDDLETLFEEVFRKTCYNEGFDLFHDTWGPGEDLFEMLNALTVAYVHELDKRSVFLYGSNPTPFYSYDLEGDVEINLPMDSDDAALIIIEDRYLPTCVK